MELVILCGGFGKRLGKITKKTPKPLINFYGKSFLEHLINFYKKYDLEKIYLLTSYKSDLFFKKFHKKKFNNIECICIKENKPKGTGGALHEIKKYIKKNFILINGDSFLNYDLHKFTKIKMPKNVVGKVILIKNLNYKSNTNLSNLTLKKNIVQYTNKKESKYMNAGIYIFRKNIFRKIRKGYSSLEKDVLENLIKKEKIIGQIENGFFIDIGLKKNLQKSYLSLKKYFLRPGIFLDRDGTINVDTGYPHVFNKLIWRNKFLNLIKNYSKFFDFYIITNQSGIGRGYYSIKNFLNLQNKIKKYLNNYNIQIKDFEYCPHHPTKALGKFKKKCNCRKPNTKMISTLIKRNTILKKKSIIIGDSKNDEKLAKNTKIKFSFSNNYYDLDQVLKKLSNKKT